MNVEHVFRTHGEELFIYLARQCGDPQSAQDAVQETFMRLQQKPPANDRGIRLWLFRTGMNVIRDEQKVRANRQRILSLNSDAVPAPDATLLPDQQVERDEDLSRLRGALSELRDRERTALLMRESGFTHREIAEALGTTTGTIGTLIARSLEKLESAMKRPGEAPW